jgi:hypothetical protein
MTVKSLRSIAPTRRASSLSAAEVGTTATSGRAGRAERNCGSTKARMASPDAIQRASLTRIIPLTLAGPTQTRKGWWAWFCWLNGAYRASMRSAANPANSGEPSPPPDKPFDPEKPDERNDPPSIPHRPPPCRLPFANDAFLHGSDD